MLLKALLHLKSLNLSFDESLAHNKQSWQHLTTRCGITINANSTNDWRLCIFERTTYGLILLHFIIKGKALIAALVQVSQAKHC